MKANLIEKTPSAHPHQMLIKSLIQTPLTRNTKNEIVYKGEKRFTYDEMYKRVCKLANALTEMGIKHGDTVAVMDYDSNRYLELYFAVPMIGAVLHTVNIRLSPEQIVYTIEHAEDDAVFIHSDFLPLFDKIKGKITCVNKYIALSEDGIAADTSLTLEGEYEEILSKQPDSFDFPDFDENTRATTFYTTGTTGLPKGVYFSHKQLVLHTIAVAGYFSSVPHCGFDQTDVYMPMTPMFHVHAWGFPYVATYTGVKQVYPGKYIPEVMLGLVIKEKVTFSHCVPTIIHMLLKAPIIDQLDLSKWKVVIGGAAMPKSMCVGAMKHGIDIIAGYGMSETCPVLTLAHVSEDMLKESHEAQADLRVLTGKPMGMVELRIVNDKMEDVPADGESTGEIVVRAPWLTQGYFKDNKNSEELWRGGYLHTGDVAVMLPNGDVKITDRAKDVIKIGGEWVSSLELEDIFSRHNSVAEVAVVSSKDDKWGERPLALIVLKEGEEVTEKELHSHAISYIKKGIMARESLLVKVKFVDEIDKTSVGKIDKKLLRQKYAL
ncbi:MAG: long-chain fatty acid--CoA ligase [Denitrovibrio sp.]|nr:MAG: long-chain fatty acid--CoA ligase [Denitrovibrio sp.]